MCSAMANMFWGDFWHLYLPLLNHRHKWVGPDGNLKVGDLVVVNDDPLLHCHCWPLASEVRATPDHYDAMGIGCARL